METSGKHAHYLSEYTKYARLLGLGDQCRVLLLEGKHMLRAVED